MKSLIEIGHGGYSVTAKGEVYSLHSKRFLSGFINPGGYRSVSLSNGDGTFKQYQIHRIIATIYIPNPDTKPYVNHIDGNKLNNAVYNLEWVTGSENNNHAYRLGLNKGKNHGTVIDHDKIIHNPYEKDHLLVCELNEELVRDVCDLIQEGYRDTDISRVTNVNRRYVNNIRHKKAKEWINVIKEYEFSFRKEERLSPEKVIEICELLSTGHKILEVSHKLSISRKNVANIRNRKTFKNISCKYDFN